MSSFFAKRLVAVVRSFISRHQFEPSTVRIIYMKCIVLINFRHGIGCLFDFSFSILFIGIKKSQLKKKQFIFLGAENLWAWRVLLSLHATHAIILNLGFYRLYYQSLYAILPRLWKRSKKYRSHYSTIYHATTQQIMRIDTKLELRLTHVKKSVH